MSTDVGIISSMLHPPLQLCSLELALGSPLTETGWFINPNAFGIVWEFDTIPVEFGYTKGYVDTYEQRLVQFVATNNTLFAGNEIPVDIINVDTLYGVYMFSQPPIARLGYVYTPGLSSRLYWVKLL